MKNIIIVECTSSGTEYIRDIRNLGYNPIIIETNISNPETMKVCAAYRKDCYTRIQAPFPDVIHDTGDFELLLNRVSSYDPIAVIPGHELGVATANKIAERLGLPCNPSDIIPAMTNKYDMHMALKKAGIRYIKSKLVSTPDEAVDFFREIKKPIAIKHNTGGGSIGFHVCSDEDEIIKAVEEEMSRFNLYGDQNTTLLVQEYINGTEYLVDIICQNGKQYFEFLGKYRKVLTYDGRKIYDYIYYPKNANLVEEDKKLIAYAMKAVEAIGIKYGPVHGEYMIDEDGVVLLEVNCRPCGIITGDFTDAIIGTHETLLSLKAYLGMDLSGLKSDPDECLNSSSDKKDNFKSGIMKTITIPKDMIAKEATILNWVNKLPSFHSTQEIETDYPRQLYRTVDLATIGGLVLLLNNNDEELWADYNTISDAELNHFDKLFK